MLPDQGDRGARRSNCDLTGAARLSLISAIVAPHRLDIRVYYEDTDFSGVVYHASYLRFLERGRTEFLRARGVHHRAIFAAGGGQGFSFAVRNMTLDFAKPALMDDMLCVETRIEALGGASIDMAQALLREGELLVAAKVRIAVVAGGRARRIPAEILAKLGEAAQDRA